MHPLLERQLRRFLGDRPTLPPAPGGSAWQNLLASISDAYTDADEERRLTERSLELMSDELNERNTALQRELAERTEAEAALQQEKQEQEALIRRLESAQQQLIQSEKMASIGQLAAGVAHEINNPVGYVQSNLSSLKRYLEDLFALADALEATAAALPPDHPLRARIADSIRASDLAFLREDVPNLMEESLDGVARVRKIVQDLRDFSHPDEGLFAWNDLHEGLRSTLNIVHNELKYKADVLTEFGELPRIECNLGQLNQVFLNLLVNAGHAIAEHGEIRVATRHLPESDAIVVSVTDTGCGIAPDKLPRIFDPFYTTKPVGKGTGLGLSLSYSIVQRHHGRIEVESSPGAGTTFRVTLPVRQIVPEDAQEEAPR